MFVGFVIGFVTGFFMLAAVILYFIHLDDKESARLENMKQYAQIDTEETIKLYTHK